MTAQTLPRQRTQRAFCPYCDAPAPGLLASCNKPDCIVAEIAEITRADRRFDDE